ncbi:hypothetical protein [Mucilaginibacter ginkgonis]|uniref:Uncharacterized protein n=1 Tax=Mucilaginibacter ginkgonis TaxID=2682091 RepID=A0A6I4HVQ7_9SPHI|nr:hypothetical protein [Mucilaginibacter ginkgonis]QQL50344.1 hypothetical protein GO620_002495 [Mucilaginibacter ginkgonis]
MITKTFKTTGGKLQVSIPETIREISLGQLIALQSTTQMNDLDAISILSGTPLSQIRLIKDFADLHHFSVHIAKLSEQIRAAYDSDSLPKTVCFDVDGSPKDIAVITNLAIEPAGAFMAARDLITEEINKHVEMHGEEDWKNSFNPSLSACAMILAHYFYSKVTRREYNEYRAEEFIKVVKRLPFTDALPIAKYFFLNYPNLSKPKISCWHRVQLLWKKRLALSSFKSSGMLTQ